MADKIYSIEIYLRPKQAEDILSRVEDPGLTDTQRVATVAQHLLTQIADGGLLISAHGMKRIQAACGVDPQDEEDITTLLSEATGMSEGKHKVIVLVDPADWDYYQEIAASGDRTAEELFQDVMDQTIENDWVLEVPVERKPERILVTKQDKQDLEETLGEAFTTGTELLALVRKVLAGEVELFAEPSNVAQAQEEAGA